MIVMCLSACGIGGLSEGAGPHAQQLVAMRAQARVWETYWDSKHNLQSHPACMHRARTLRRLSAAMLRYRWSLRPSSQVPVLAVQGHTQIKPRFDR